MKNKNILTIFTPTYNRSHTLPKLFESLCSQKDKNFIWLIIDDGSTDDTKNIVQSFINKSDFKINYVYKNNGGKHTAINKMLEIVDSEITFIVDSDDYITTDAVQTVLYDYSKYQNSEICEILYLKGYENGKVVGEEFANSNQIVDAKKELINTGINGDKANVIFNNKFKKYKFPVYKNEKYMGESVLWHRVYEDNRKVVLINQVIYICEYLNEGLTKYGRKLRILNPLAGMEYARNYFLSDIRKILKIKYGILYICYAKFAKLDFNDIMNKFPNKKYLFICIIPGNLLKKYWNFKYMRN